MSKREKYTPPPRPHPIAGPELHYSPAAIERKLGYRQIAAECSALAGTEAESAAEYIERVYGIGLDRASPRRNGR